VKMKDLIATGAKVGLELKRDFSFHYKKPFDNVALDCGVIFLIFYKRGCSNRVGIRYENARFFCPWDCGCFCRRILRSSSCESCKAMPT
jgi:hypothetical protein